MTLVMYLIALTLSFYGIGVRGVVKLSKWVAASLYLVNVLLLFLKGPLGPILFIIFINVLFDKCNEHTIVFADDTNKIIISKDIQFMYS